MGKTTTVLPIIVMVQMVIIGTPVTVPNESQEVSDAAMKNKANNNNIGKKNGNC